MPRHISTRSSRVSSPAYWRLLKTMSRILRLVKPLPSTISRVMISPIRVRSVRSVSSSPTIRGKPVSGSFGFDSQ
jgi:hypothetical protein